MNEEEVKVQIVIPWLETRGFERSDLQLEHTFTIRVGRQVIAIGGPEFALHRARFDILVRRGEKNLFIVETKAVDLPLTEEDRDQAISYARLVHPIAPFALVTNGREVQLYHSITRERIEPEQMEALGFDAHLESDALLETQSRFLRLSRANFTLFCHAQVDSELRRVRGDLASGKKYVPALHVAREALHRTFGDFLASSAPCLLLSGASGAGKTSELCCLAESLLAENEPVFFFSGPALSANLCEAITAEFAWSFEEAHSPVQTLKRIESVLPTGTLAIIIDAVDEWSNASAIQQLDELVRAAENHRIRVILGCKSTAVPALLDMGNLTSFVELLARKTPLPPLTDKEFYSAIDRYREAYHFRGAFERDVLKQAREKDWTDANR